MRFSARMMLGRLLSPLARRFVAGQKAADAVAVAQAVNRRGLGTILDFLGEDVSTPADASAAADEYVRLLQAIQSSRVNAAVSVKLSQLGLLINRALCLDNLRRVLQEAVRVKSFVWIDMEGSALTQKTIDAYDELRGEFAPLGLCLQSYLVRTGGDVDRLITRPAFLRLCKGAYKEPPSIAFADRRAVEANYRNIAQKLLAHSAQGIVPAFATHDAGLLDDLVRFARDAGVPAGRFEFQMLYGIQNQRLQALAEKGFQTRVYIPYGTAWLPYFLRRLRERKENIYFLAKNVFSR